MFPENLILPPNKAHSLLTCLRGCEKRFSTFMLWKNNKMSYCQESPRCGAGVRECYICYSVCIINSWLGMLQLKCEMSGFINKTVQKEWWRLTGGASGAAGCGYRFSEQPWSNRGMCTVGRICDLGENTDFNPCSKEREEQKKKRALKSEIKGIIHSSLKSVGIISSQWGLD